MIDLNKHKCLQSKNVKLEYTSQQNGCAVVGFSLPQLLTCPCAGECVRYCSASVGQQAYKNVRLHHRRNLELTELSPRSVFIDKINKELRALRKKGLPLVVRLHPCGDFYSVEYVELWAEIFEANPDVMFYCYTKSWKMVLEVFDSLVNPNFVAIPSEGGKDDVWLDACHMVRAYVCPENETELRQRSVWGSKDELDNLLAYVSGYSVALRAHGAKKGYVKA